MVGSTCGWGRGPANMFSVGSYEDKKQRYRIINNANESYTIQKIDWQLLSTQIYVHGKFNSISFNKAINCFLNPKLNNCKPELMKKAKKECYEKKNSQPKPEDSIIICFKCGKKWHKSF